MNDESFTAATSFSQQRLWLIEQLQPAGAAYTIPDALRLRGTVDEAALRRALRAVVARHESLRTTFREVDGAPVQVIAASAEVPLAVHDLSAEPAAVRNEVLRARLSAEASVPFDLVGGPLIRAALYRLDVREHVLLLLTHHIVSDAWSVAILRRELTQLYAGFASGNPLDLPELPVQYADFAEWQRGWLAGEPLKGQQEYWRKQLAGAPQVLELPSDRPRPPLESHGGAQFAFSVPRGLVDRARAVAQREGATLFMALLAAYGALLSRYSGQEEFLVGTPIAGRNRTEVEGLIGFFVNTLVVRCDLSGDPTVAELLRRLRDTCLGAYAHQDLPFESLVEQLRPERDLSRNPLFQVMLILENMPEQGLELPGVQLDSLHVDRGAAQVDLSLYLRETPHGLRATFEYATDLFDESRIAGMAAHFTTLLEGMAERVDARVATLPVLSREELSQQRSWNATDAGYSEACVYELVKCQVARTPERVALEFEARTLSYGELDRRVEHLARRLRRRGVVPGKRVGVFMERSPEMVVAVLAVLSAGGAYVPLDPAFPDERLAFMMEDSAAEVVLTHAVVADRVPSRAVEIVRVDEDESVDLSPAAGPAPQDLAYLIYTSGSTGRPKGVGITHRSLVNLLESMGREIGFADSDVLLSVTTLSFDIAALELFLPLLKGGKVILTSRDDALDGARLIEHLSASRATVMQATPATWRLLLESGWSGTPGLKVLRGGEPLPRDLADALLARVAELWNGYGPTETTVYSTTEHVRPGSEPIAIGRPIANTQTWVLDKGLQPQPVGVPGELCIGGIGVASGYWQRPELTAEKFVPDPFSAAADARLYRTGDLACWLPSGRLACLGRLDHQVKLRGFRIELGEIESALRECPGVEQAAVVLLDVAGDRRLVAYLTGGAPQGDAGSLRDRLAARLPNYMIPSSFVSLAALPLTPNGKIDRRALTKIGVPAAANAGPPAGDITATQRLVAEIWEKVMGTPAAGVHEDFFRAGGHSLAAARFVARLRSTFGVEVGIRNLFERPTIAGLAETLDVLLLAGRSATPDSTSVGREEFDL